MLTLPQPRQGRSVFVCKSDLECPEDRDFDEHYHSFEKCATCGRMTTCAECLCGRER